MFLSSMFRLTAGGLSSQRQHGINSASWRSKRSREGAEARREEQEKNLRVRPSMFVVLPFLSVLQPDPMCDNTAAFPTTADVSLEILTYSDILTSYLSSISPPSQICAHPPEVMPTHRPPRAKRHPVHT